MPVGSSQHEVTFGIPWVPSDDGCPIESHNLTLVSVGSYHFGVTFGIPWVPSSWGRPNVSHNITLVSIGSSQHGVRFGIPWVPPSWGHPTISHNITQMMAGPPTLGSHLGSYGSLPVGAVPPHPIISPCCQLGPPLWGQIWDPMGPFLLGTSHHIPQF